MHCNNCGNEIGVKESHRYLVITTEEPEQWKYGYSILFPFSNLVEKLCGRCDNAMMDALDKIRDEVFSSQAPIDISENRGTMVSVT